MKQSCIYCNNTGKIETSQTTPYGGVLVIDCKHCEELTDEDWEKLRDAGLDSKLDRLIDL